MIFILTLIYIIYVIKHFSHQNKDLVLQRFMFNGKRILYVIFGIILILVTNIFDFTKYIILVIYTSGIVINLLSFIITFSGIKLIHLVDKKTKQADSKYKLTINLFPIVSYGYIILLTYILFFQN